MAHKTKTANARQSSKRAPFSAHGENKFQQRRRRLKREMQHLRDGIEYIRQQIRFSPYESDRPELQNQLREWLADLAAANRDFDKIAAL